MERVGREKHALQFNLAAALSISLFGTSNVLVTTSFNRGKVFKYGYDSPSSLVLLPPWLFSIYFFLGGYSPFVVVSFPVKTQKETDLID